MDTVIRYAGADCTFNTITTEWECKDVPEVGEALTAMLPVDGPSPSDPDLSRWAINQLRNAGQEFEILSLAAIQPAVAGRVY